MVFRHKSRQNLSLLNLVQRICISVADLEIRNGWCHGKSERRPVMNRGAIISRGRQVKITKGSNLFCNRVWSMDKTIWTSDVSQAPGAGDLHMASVQMFLPIDQIRL